MRILPKKPAADYFEQLLKTGQPLTDKTKKAADSEMEHDREVDDNLLEIYQDESGQTVDVRNFSVRHRRWWLKVVFFLIYSSVLLVVGWLGYNYYTSYRAKTDLLTISIETDKNLTAGQDFACTVNYHNNGSVPLADVELKLDWPAGFIFAQAEPAPAMSNNLWQIGDIPAKSGGQIIIHGRLINKIGESNQLSAQASFRPINLSSTFVATGYSNAILSDSSLAIGLSAPDTFAVGRGNEVVINYQSKAGNQIDNLKLLVNSLDWADVKLVNSNDQPIELSADQGWILPAAKDQLSVLKLIVTPKPEADGQKVLSIRLETKLGDKSYLLDSRDFDCQLVNSNLNLLLKVNDSNAGSGVSAGQLLKYQLSYTNQGNNTLKDVRLTAVLQGSWLDWPTLKDPENGQVSGQTISWSKKEKPELALLKPGASGVIDFTIKLKDWATGDKTDSGELVSYGYYQTDNATASPGDNQKSNTVTSQLNSDLSFHETVVYFNEDNIAVGSGPLPLIVGETTNLKVYWRLSNNLHDLRDAAVVAELPDYITWAGKNNTTNGQITYDQDSHQVTWKLAGVPANTKDLVGEFSLGVTPRSDQKNRIIILTSGSTVTATDNVTQSRLTVTGPAKTSRLEDDQIAQTDGLVR